MDQPSWVHNVDFKLWRYLVCHPACCLCSHGHPLEAGTDLVEKHVCDVLQLAVRAAMGSALRLAQISGKSTCVWHHGIIMLVVTWSYT